MWTLVPSHHPRLLSEEFSSCHHLLSLLQCQFLHVYTLLPINEMPFSSFPCLRESESRSVVSDSLRPHGLYSPWDSPGQNTGVGSLPLLQGIFPTQGSNPGHLHCRWILYQLSHKGSPPMLKKHIKQNLSHSPTSPPLATSFLSSPPQSASVQGPFMFSFLFNCLSEITSSLHLTESVTDFLFNTIEHPAWLAIPSSLNPFAP